MRIRFPIFGRGRESHQVRTRFGITDKAATGAASPTFHAVQYTKPDGTRIKLVSIGQLGNKSALGAAGTPMQPTLRIARIIEDASSSGVEIELFLESCWIHILPGSVPGQVFYSPHLKTDYDARAQYPAWLDWAINLGASFRIRKYIPWMNDTEIYTAGHERNLTDTQYNNYSHAGRIGIFTRCCLASKLDTALFLDLLDAPSSTVLSYGIYVDDNLDYWLLKVTQTGVWKARIAWHFPGEDLHAQMKAEAGEGVKIDMHSALHANLRKSEAYLFATAKNVGSFELLYSTTVEGLSIYYGWDFNWDGNKGVHVTIEYPYPVEEGIRCRLYDLTIDAVSTTITERENILGTPDLSVLTGYYPEEVSVPGRMNAWFQKALTDSWTDIATNIPLYAYFEDEDNDTPCEWWFQVDLRVTHPSVGSFNTWINTLPSLCGGGLSHHEGFSHGGYTQYKGLYSVNKASGNEDYRKTSRETISDHLYTAEWYTFASGQSGCVRIGGGGTFDFHPDCGDWDDSGGGSQTVTAQQFRAEYQT